MALQVLYLLYSPLFRCICNMMQFIKNHKRFFKWVMILLGVVLLSIVCSNYWITNSTKTQLYTDVTKIPYRKVGLVLGASKQTSRGTPNLYFKFRMQAAYQLYKAHKVQYLLVSGDNHIKGYDEPSDMREALILLGVPDSCIVLDYAGFRTLDSVVRCDEVFGEDSVTIISQEFHNQRAVFIANASRTSAFNKINAIAFNAQEVNKHYSFKNISAEYFV